MTMAVAPVATNFNKTLDVKVNLFSKVTLNLILMVNNLSETVDLSLSEAICLGVRANTRMG